jgi:hypothetical protein
MKEDGIDLLFIVQKFFPDFEDGVEICKFFVVLKFVLLMLGAVDLVEYVLVGSINYGIF